MEEPADKPLRFATRAAFRAWADAQTGRGYERFGGEVVGMAPERARQNVAMPALFG